MLCSGGNTKPYQHCTAVEDRTKSHIVTGYIKPAYDVLVGDTVKVFSTNSFASLPRHDKFLVKERIHDPTVGYARAKLVLKSCLTDSEVNENGFRFVNITWLEIQHLILCFNSLF